jgi:predicted molibdopterin-dependent oxidoreductase YjgC
MQISGYCTLCRSRCGTLNTVEGDRLVRVDPDPSHPTGHAMCSKGRAAPELAFSSRRLLSPMRRTRSKTDQDPGWQENSWDEAMSVVAAKLAAQKQAAGAESVAFGVTSPSAFRRAHLRCHRLDRAFLQALRQSELLLFHRDLQLAQGLRLQTERQREAAECYAVDMPVISRV